MASRTAAIVVALLLSAKVALAQTCTVPNTLANGTNADATQVMANFNALLTCINGGGSGQALQGYLGGLTISNNATTPNTVIDTAVGIATSDDGTVSMKIVSAFTKNANAAWAVGSGNGCLDVGSALSNLTWYHLYVIQRTDTNVVDELCSTSATAPALPTNYTKKRRIGSFKTNVSAQIVAFTQLGDEFIWSTPVTDINPGTVGTTATPVALPSVPSGVKVNALIRADMTNVTAWAGLIFAADEITTVIAPAGNFNLNAAAGAAASGQFSLRTNTSQQIKAVATVAGTTMFIVTYGWTDSRGRFN